SELDEAAVIVVAAPHIVARLFRGEHPIGETRRGGKRIFLLHQFAEKIDELFVRREECGDDCEREDQCSFRFESLRRRSIRRLKTIISNSAALRQLSPSSKRRVVRSVRYGASRPRRASRRSCSCSSTVGR